MPQKPYLEAGQIVGTHGVRGEVRVQVWCDSPEQFAGFRQHFGLVSDGKGLRSLQTEQRHGDGNPLLERV